MIPADCVHNAHMFYLKCKDLARAHGTDPPPENNDILAVFHYIRCTPPRQARSSAALTARMSIPPPSERLVRLPMYYGLTESDRDQVIEKVLEFYAQ